MPLGMSENELAELEGNSVDFRPCLSSRLSKLVRREMKVENVGLNGSSNQFKKGNKKKTTKTHNR